MLAGHPIPRRRAPRRWRAVARKICSLDILSLGAARPGAGALSRARYARWTSYPSAPRAQALARCRAQDMLAGHRLCLDRRGGARHGHLDDEPAPARLVVLDADRTAVDRKSVV